MGTSIRHISALISMLSLALVFISDRQSGHWNEPLSH
jgi:hypothetical protein